MDKLIDYALVIPGRDSSLYINGLDMSVSLLDNSIDAGKFRHVTSDELISIYNVRKNSKESLHVWLYLTLDCDFACQYCIQSDAVFTPGQMMGRTTIDNVIDFINLYKDASTKYVEIVYFGGEPLLNFDIIEYAYNAFETGIDVPVRHSMITNGYALNDNKIRKFSDIIIDAIQITLDGYKDIHDKRRMTIQGRLGTYDIIRANIEKILKVTKNTKIHIRTVVDRYNVDHITNLVDQEHTLFSHPRVTWDISKVKALHQEDFNSLLFTDDEFSKFYEHVVEYAIEHGINVVPPEHGGCSLHFTNTIFISPDGSLYKCPSMVDNKMFSFGNVFTKQMNTWDSRFNNNVYLREQCLLCELFYHCNGGCKYNAIVNKREKQTICRKQYILRNLTNYYTAKYRDLLD